MGAYAEGWPVAKQAGGTVNPTYCYGAVGVARDAAPDTGNGSELFTVIGGTARRLDRNYALVGRVIYGMENLPHYHAGRPKWASMQRTRWRRRFRPMHRLGHAGSGASALRVSKNGIARVR